MVTSPSKKDLNVHICELLQTSGSNLPKLPPNARFYCRLKRSFQKLILVSVKHPLTRFLLRSQAAVAFEKRRHGRSSNWWIIHPCSTFRFCWDLLMTLNFLFIFAMVPHIITFHRITKSSGSEYWHFVYPSFVICVIDICLNFITGFVSQDGHEIFLDPVLIARHYLQGYFFVDLISSVPYTWFYREQILPPGPDSNSPLLILEFLPVLKILRIRTLRYYIRQINTIYGISHSKEMTIWLVLLTLLIFHWSSCVTYIFPYLVMHALRDSIENSGAYVVETELYKKSDWKIYLTSLHMGVSNLVGSSFTEFESLGILDKIIRCILLLLGRGYMFYLIVIILQLAESSAESELKYQQIMHQVKEYIQEKKLPRHLRDKLIAYYEYRYQGSFFKENAISSTLSTHLNLEILVHSSRGLFDRTTILRNLPRTLLTNLMNALRPVIYMKDDVIYRADAEGDCMFFIASGTVALITFTGKEVCHLQDGDFFGETSLIYPDRRRLVSVIALEICELLRLDRRFFKRFVPPKSDLYIRLETVAMERLEKIKELTESQDSAKE